MSSTETSGAAPAEATATTPAGDTAAPVFGSSRGSGLARGKRPANGPAAPTTTPVKVDYKPTAIEIVTAPREYQNPFAPANPEPAQQAETPAAVTPEPAASTAPAPVAPIETPAAPAATKELFPLDSAPAAAPAASEEPAELNILPPERAKTAPAQTWESEGFRPAREPRADRPRRDDRREGEQRAEAPVPSKFRYERAKDGPLPPREPPSSYAKPATQAAPAAKKSGGFLGWLKSLFGGAPAAQPGEHRHGDRDGHRHHRRHRGGRGRGQPQGQAGEQMSAGGDSHRGEHREHRGDRQDGGFRRRRRGGRNRGGFRGEHREGGGDSGGAPQGN